ncbi:hypothetical protein V494_05051 [Pseudogymnoascus sp. VKM F-4513 (FW-928)]|nr:hypothetical protein V494_05051 [Pseudogymnoascus sp. VKM F-4513 (FW-928)]
MFQFDGGKKERETCFVTHGAMGHLDPAQPPVKRKPYSAILAVPFVHKAELILPQDFYESIQSDMDSKFAVPTYSRVILPLAELLSGDFFTEYIKKGNVLMLSEGKHGVNDVYSLRDGVLTLALEKESYERAGLAGEPDGAKGKRGARARWLVEINLRQPSMLHGKKGFDRIVYAFKNVLNTPVTWLFCNLEGEAPSPDPLSKHFPVKISCPPSVTRGPIVNMPNTRPPTSLGGDDGDDFGEFAAELYEWLSLISLESPRVDANDRIDPFLSRYTSPPSDKPEGESQALVKVTWKGFMSSSWAHKTFVSAVLAATTNSWFSFSVSGFPDSLPATSRDCTISKIPGNSSEFMLWEVEHN